MCLLVEFDHGAGWLTDSHQDVMLVNYSGIQLIKLLRLCIGISQRGRDDEVLEYVRGSMSNALEIA